MTKPTINFDALAEAIHKAEGGDKTRYPYGIQIKSPFGGFKQFTKAKAKEICIRTCRNNYDQWRPPLRLLRYTAADFIAHLSLTYCTDHKNWTKNVTYFYERTRH